MTDRFISPMPLPTPRQRELLTILIEECAEVAQRATKLLRFGRDEIQPGQNLTNAQRLSAELGDLMVMVNMCRDAELISFVDMEAAKDIKRAKVVKFLQSEPD